MKINKRRQRHLTSDPAAAIDPAATCCCDKSVAMATQHPPTSTAPSVSFGLPIWKVQRSLNDSIVCPSATFVHRLATTSRCVARPLPVVNIPQFTTKRAAVQIIQIKILTIVNLWEETSHNLTVIVAI